MKAIKRLHRYVIVSLSQRDKDLIQIRITPVFLWLRWSFELIYVNWTWNAKHYKKLLILQVKLKKADVRPLL